MCPRNLPGEREVVARDVGLRVPSAVLELDLKPPAELLEIILRVYLERGADLLGLTVDLTLIGHGLPPAYGVGGNDLFLLGARYPSVARADSPIKI